MSHNYTPGGVNICQLQSGKQAANDQIHAVVVVAISKEKIRIWLGMLQVAAVGHGDKMIMAMTMMAAMNRTLVVACWLLKRAMRTRGR